MYNMYAGKVLMPYKIPKTKLFVKFAKAFLPSQLCSNDCLLLTFAGLTFQDGHTSSMHPPPHGNLDSSPWKGVCGEEGSESSPTVPALLCEEPR